MAINRIDVSPHDDVSAISVAVAGTVTNSIRIEYEATDSKETIMAALEKARMKLDQVLNGGS